MQEPLSLPDSISIMSSLKATIAGKGAMAMQKEMCSMFRKRINDSMTDIMDMSDAACNTFQPLQHAVKRAHVVNFSEPVLWTSGSAFLGPQATLHDETSCAHHA